MLETRNIFPLLSLEDWPCITIGDPSHVGKTKHIPSQKRFLVTVVTPVVPETCPFRPNSLEELIVIGASGKEDGAKPRKGDYELGGAIRVR